MLTSLFQISSGFTFDGRMACIGPRTRVGSVWGWGWMAWAAAKSYT